MAKQVAHNLETESVGAVNLRFVKYIIPIC